MGDAEVKHETPASGLRLEIVLDLNIAAPLARAGRHAVIDGIGPVPVSVSRTEL